MIGLQNNSKGEMGFSLLELLIVVCIIGLIGIIAGLQYSKWMRTYNVEREMRELHADLLNARANSMMRNRCYFVTLSANAYTVYEDTNPAPDGNGSLEVAADTVRVSKTLSPNNGITWSGAAQINFSTKGVPGSDEVICSNADVRTDNNCVVLSATRTNLGRLNTTIPGGGACDTANCIVR